MKEAQFNNLFFDSEKEQPIVENILQTLIKRNYDYVLRIDAETGIFKMYGQGNEKGYFPMQSGMNYDEMCEKYHPLVAYPEDLKKFEYYSRLSTIEERLQEMNEYSFTIRTKNIDGTIAWKRYTYTYLDRMHRILLQTRRDITEYIVQSKNQESEGERLQEEWRQVSNFKGELYSLLNRVLRENMDEIHNLCLAACEMTETEEEIPEAFQEYLTGILRAEQTVRKIIREVLGVE